MSTATRPPAAPSVLRDLARLAWPVLVAQLAVMAHGLIDTLMAGRHSTEDLAAVGIGGAVFFSVFGPLMGVQLALTPLAARLYGAGRPGEIGEQVRQAGWLSLALSVAAILIYRHPDAFLVLSRPAPEVEVKVRDFLAIMAWGVPTAMLFRIFQGYSTAVSRPRVIMLLNLAGLALKIPLNAWFISGGWGLPALGASGCALSTVVVSWLVCGTAWLWCARGAVYHPFAVFARWSWPDRRALGQLLSLGVPIGFTFMVDVTAFTFMALFVARLGAATSAAHQIAANTAALCFMLPLALGNAAGVLVGQALGARQFVLARRTGLISLAVGSVLACCLALAIAFGAPRLALLYSNDAEVRVVAAGLLVFVAGYHLFDALQAVTVNVLRAYKRTLVPMVIYGVGLWGVGLAGGYQLGLGDADLAWLGVHPPMGARGFWAGAIAGMCLAGLAVAAYFFRVTEPARARRAEGRAAVPAA